MLARRYGTAVQSVSAHFDARAMTEIGFRRTADLSLPADEFFRRYEKVDERALGATSEGDVKDEAEQALLASLEARLDALAAEVGPGHVLLIESQAGQDYPKTRDRTETRVVGYENRLYFHWWIDPPLRIGIYRPK